MLLADWLQHCGGVLLLVLFPFNQQSAPQECHFQPDGDSPHFTHRELQLKEKKWLVEIRALFLSIFNSKRGERVALG